MCIICNRSMTYLKWCTVLSCCASGIAPGLILTSLNAFGLSYLIRKSSLLTKVIWNTKENSLNMYIKKIANLLGH